MIVKCPAHNSTARLDRQGRVVRPCRECVREAVHATIAIVAKALR